MTLIIGVTRQERRRAGAPDPPLVWTPGRGTHDLQSLRESVTLPREMTARVSTRSLVGRASLSPLQRRCCSCFVQHMLASCCCGCCARSCCRSSPAWRSPICSIRSPTGWSASASTASSHRSSSSALFVLASSLLILLFVPVLIGQLGAFIEKFPGYVSRLQALAMDPNREWLRKFVGEGVADAQVGDLVDAGRGLGRDLPAARSGPAARRCSRSSRSWSSRRSSPSICCSTGTAWSRAVDGWIPLQHRETVHGLAREIDAAIAGFVRGQAAVCLILASFYAIGADADRSQFRPPDRPDHRASQFYPLCRLDDRAWCSRSASRSRSSGRIGRRS